MPEQQDPNQQPISGAISLGRIFGVPIRLHFTFLLLLAFLLFNGIGEKQSGGATTIYIISLFASVLLHEIGHTLVARHYGIKTLEIVMFPIGGVSRMERPLKPAEELWVSAAGPLMNLLISAAIFAWLISSHESVSVKLSELAQPTDQNVLPRLAFGNLLLAIFNLLPAFPMDGGRVLRALLSFIRPEDEATRIASWMGRALAFSIGLYGLLAPQFMLVFFAFFIYMGAAQEGAAALGRTLTHGIPVRAAMITEFHTLGHGDTIRDAANLLLATSQQDFPVKNGDQVIGLLGRNLLLKALAQEGPDAYVAGVMDRDFLQIEPSRDLAEVLPLMAQAGRCALVMDGDKLVGLLTTDNLSEFLLLRRFGMDPAV